MVVTGAVEIIRKLEYAVARRKQLLALQDGVAMAVAVGGLVSAGVVLYVRLRPIDARWWAVALLVLGTLIVSAVVRALIKRPAAGESAFLIDHSLDLEDRLTTAHSIIEKGGPSQPLEGAVIEDAAARISAASASSLVPLRVRRWYGLSLLSLIALVSAVGIPERSLPGGEALIAAREDIQKAGEQLEQNAEKIEQAVAPDSKTADLAREQAALGRAFRRGNHSRSEALRNLSALEARIRQRRDELANTRADEIVSLAEKRLRSALPVEKDRRARTAQVRKDDSAVEANALDEDRSARETRGAKQSPNDVKSKTVAEAPSNLGDAKSGDRTAKAPKAGADGNDRAASAPDADRLKARNETRGESLPEEFKGKQQAEARDRAQDSVTQPEKPAAGGEERDRSSTEAAAVQQQKEEPPSNQGGGLTSLAAEQAAKAMPALSEQLLKQAAQLRLDQLTADDIERLRKAAESLSQDLAAIAQSKEFQQALEQLARQVKPEDIERVARELMSNEKLRQELQAAGRLLAENRQAKEIAAGLAQGFAGLKDRMPDRDAASRRSGNSERSPEQDRRQSANQIIALSQGGPTFEKGSVKRQDEKATARIAGKGNETGLSGRVGRGTGGEYLYLQSKARGGAIRAPYVSAYPQYRREAERSIERSQVPQRMRSVVRNYFDSINPDVRK